MGADIKVRSRSHKPAGPGTSPRRSIKATLTERFGTQSHRSNGMEPMTAELPTAMLTRAILAERPGAQSHRSKENLSP